MYSGSYCPNNGLFVPLVASTVTSLDLTTIQYLQKIEPSPPPRVWPVLMLPVHPCLVSDTC